jgi:site-specific DNA-methyltransferase (cytosine-N4-specific)
MMDEDTGVQLLQGDARSVLATLPAESVHMVVTSPPYHGLRDYGTGLWEGGEEGCDHVERTAAAVSASNGLGHGASCPNRHSLPPTNAAFKSKETQFREVCGKCSARRVDQQIGLEPSAEEHIAALVEVFALVKRCLRKDGVLAINYGDAYSGSWGNQGRKEGRGEQRPINGPMIQNLEVGYPDRKGGSAPELPAKNLLMLPARLAIALQADGWILRSMIPWLKRSAMPESATDRPSTAVEYVFLFSRSQRYYWDQEAVRRPHVRIWDEKNGGTIGSADGSAWWQGAHRKASRGGTGPALPNPNGRNLRNSDFYFDSLDLAIEATRAELAHLLHLREKGGLLLSGDEPLALDVNPQALKFKHYAAFPERLVSILIQAGCPLGGTVLDPFVGSGTTLKAASKLGRQSIGIELSEDYMAIARHRTAQLGLML